MFSRHSLFRTASELKPTSSKRLLKGNETGNPDISPSFKPYENPLPSLALLGGDKPAIPSQVKSGISWWMSCVSGFRDRRFGSFAVDEVQVSFPSELVGSGRDCSLEIFSRPSSK